MHSACAMRVCALRRANRTPYGSARPSLLPLAPPDLRRAQRALVLRQQRRLPAQVREEAAALDAAVAHATAAVVAILLHRVRRRRARRRVRQPGGRPKQCGAEHGARARLRGGLQHHAAELAAHLAASAG